MSALSHRRLIQPTLLFAAAILLNGPTKAAELPCDRRLLPHNDTLSVEAAARAATGERPNTIHVTEACITGTTTSVILTTPRGQMTCKREPSTWSRRGGWKCDEPRNR